MGTVGSDDEGKQNCVGGGSDEYHFTVEKGVAVLGFLGQLQGTPS